MIIEILSALFAVVAAICIWLSIILFKKQSQLATLGQKLNDTSLNLSTKEQIRYCKKKILKIFKRSQSYQQS